MLIRIASAEKANQNLVYLMNLSKSTLEEVTVVYTIILGGEDDDLRLKFPNVGILVGSFEWD